MARITFSITPELAAAAKSRAEGQRRSLSNYLSVLIESDMAASASRPAIEEAAAQELRALGLDPVIVLRDAIAEVERDQAMAPAPLKPAA